MKYSADSSFIRRYGTSEGVKDAVDTVTSDVWEIFDMIAPRDTSNMVNSVRVEPSERGGTYRCELVVDIYYAKFVEGGTRYMRAQHNLRNSLSMLEEENKT